MTRQLCPYPVVLSPKTAAFANFLDVKSSGNYCEVEGSVASWFTHSQPASRRTFISFVAKSKANSEPGPKLVSRVKIRPDKNLRRPKHFMNAENGVPLCPNKKGAGGVFVPCSADASIDKRFSEVLPGKDEIEASLAEEEKHVPRPARRYHVPVKGKVQVHKKRGDWDPFKELYEWKAAGTNKNWVGVFDQRHILRGIDGYPWGNSVTGHLTLT
eukprot:TRINITY_DN63304_c0_g1_i1.p1 TRINITY_DN63304_c0_g1~~TRINITY_DN63304_c0_g1_i1.p1  ORF type:complete len:214 (+),score=13.55 TRINITY_DN63304_c0_g1_i1:85-726(+)